MIYETIRRRFLGNVELKFLEAVLYERWPSRIIFLLYFFLQCRRNVGSKLIVHGCRRVDISFFFIIIDRFESQLYLLEHLL